MARKYSIQSEDHFYFVTFTIIQWIDVFTRQEYMDIFVDSVKSCQDNKGLLVGAWRIMPNHVHMIISGSGKHKLTDIIRDLKSYTSRQSRPRCY